MSKLKLWTGIMLVFILGAVAGSMGMGMYLQHRFERFVFNDPKQGHPPHPPMLPFLMRRLDKKLDLNETQRKELEKIMRQTFEDVHSIMKEQHPELEELAKESLARIKEILDDDQKEKLVELKIFEKMKERFRHKPPFGPGFKGEEFSEMFERIKEHLQFSEAMEKEIQPIIEESFNTRRNIVESYKHQMFRNRQAMKSEMDELREKLEKQLGNILSKEQMTLFREIQEEKREMHEKSRPRPHGFGGLSDP